jgi:hypothetical protein
MRNIFVKRQKLALGFAGLFLGLSILSGQSAQASTDCEEVYLQFAAACGGGSDCWDRPSSHESGGTFWLHSDESGVSKFSFHNDGTCISTFTPSEESGDEQLYEYN